MAGIRKIFVITFILLLVPLLSSAQTITLTDPFPGTGGDVIGSKSYFDIEKATFDFNLGGTPTMNIGIYMNYNGGAISGNDFNTYKLLGVWLDPGDILFGDGANWKYGVTLSAHAGSPNGGPSGSALTKGALYRVDDQAGILTAHDVLNIDTLIYRKNEDVWLYENSPYLTKLTDATAFTISSFGDGTTQAKYLVSLAVPITQQFIDDLGSGMNVQFSVATCGNDVIGGQVRVPEPQSALLLLLGLVFLGISGGRRKKLSTQQR